MTPPAGHPTFEFLIVDLLDRMLRDIRDPERMSETLCDVLRELTGARGVAVLQFGDAADPAIPRVVWYGPPRKRSAATEHAVAAFGALYRDTSAPHRFLSREDPAAAAYAPALDALQAANALLFPLAVGDFPVGGLILAGLPEENRMDQVAGLMRRSTSVLALALRNSLLYERQEETIRARTRELAESEARFRSLAESSPVAIVRAGPDGRPRFANAPWTSISAAAGLPADAPWLAAVHPADLPRIERLWGNAIAGRGPFEAECRLAAGEGDPPTVIVKGTAKRGASGSPEEAIVTLTDVSALKRAEAIMIRSEKLDSLGVLAGGIAHDFNNLLAGILGNLSFALADLDDASPLREPLRDCEAAALRAKGLTGQLLSFARGGLPVREVSRLGPLVAETCRFALSGAKVRLELDLPDTVRAAAVDPGQFCQVIQNLALNAAQAMPGGGTIRVSAFDVRLPQGAPLPAGDYVRLDVADEGEGIPPDRLKRIFDPFFTTKRQGSGLGLAVCDAILRRHGGMIEARSTPGRGTVFTLLVPACPDGPPETAAPPPAKVRLRAQAEGRVLVVDDEEAVRIVIARMLGRFGFETVCCAEGREGVARFREAHDAGRPFRLVLLDLTIPGGMGGLETLAALKAMDPAVTAIVSSGYSEDAAMSDARGYGFAGALRKPFRMAELDELLERIGLVGEG